MVWCVRVGVQRRIKPQLVARVLGAANAVMTMLTPAVAVAIVLILVAPEDGRRMAKRAASS
jgi:hypothetical protein